MLNKLSTQGQALRDFPGVPFLPHPPTLITPYSDPIWAPVCIPEMGALMSPSRTGTEAPSSFSNGSCSGKFSREAGPSLGGSGCLRGCTERLLGFLQELLEFQKDIPREGQPAGVK